VYSGLHLTRITGVATVPSKEDLFIPSTKLIVWIVTDEKPGHKNQLLGLLEALQDYRKVSTHWITSRGCFKSYPEIKQLPSPDLIIGAGHKTHCLLLRLKFFYGGKSILLMKPSLPRFLFDCCLIPRHDKVKISNNVIETIGPLNRVRATTEKQSNYGLMLLGGISKHYDWDASGLIKQIQQLQEKQKTITWMVASSRRTPNDFLHMLTEKFPHLTIITPDTVSADWLPEAMQKAAYIWVTQDSVSMVYEAITSGAQTGLLELPVRKPTRVTVEMEHLKEENRVQTLLQYKPRLLPPLNEADRCAKLLLGRFGY
jgi:mitochondrial fission protein ELM1